MSTRSRIPAPSARGPLAQQDPNQQRQEAEDGRKRKAAAAPPRPAPAAKRGAPLAPAPRAAAPAAAPRAAAPAPAPAAADDGAAAWPAAAAEMGWETPADALAHRLAFAKRVDAKARAEALAAHVKRLRAAGWTLAADAEAAAANAASLGDALAAEKAARAAEGAAAAEAAATAAAAAAALEARAAAAESDAAAARERGDAAEARAAAADKAAAAAAERAERLAADLERAQGVAADAEQRRAAAETAAAEAQKYASQVQEFSASATAELAAAVAAREEACAARAALAEEAAAARGRAAALEAQLEAAAATASGTEASRRGAADEAARLRGDIAAVAAARDAAAADAERARREAADAAAELARWRAAAGGLDLAGFERDAAERAAAASSRSRAQSTLAASLGDRVALLEEEKALAQSQAAARGAEAKAAAARAAELEAELAAAHEKLAAAEAVRRRLHNEVLELKGNIRVFCRVRPPAPGADVAVAPVAAGDLAGRGLELAAPPAGGAKVGGEPSRLAFSFDRVFGPAASQAEVFEEVSHLVQSALDGYRVTVFAYGQTGSGKTHTMVGAPGDADGEGVIGRAMAQVFAAAAAAAERGRRYELRASMVEIYNEELRDLLGPGPPPGKKHAIGSEPGAAGGFGGAAAVSHVEWVPLGSAVDAAKLLARAAGRRAVAATACNERSSRSHVVFTLGVEGEDAATGERLRGALNLVDLAGSERVKKSGAAGAQMAEAQAINKSLAALGDVIAALGAKSAAGGKGGGEGHVPFRNSKLTHLLAPALGGSGKTLMLVNVAPERESAAETACSLRFAAKVNATVVGTARKVA